MGTLYEIRKGNELVWDLNENEHEKLVVRKSGGDKYVSRIE